LPIDLVGFQCSLKSWKVRTVLGANEATSSRHAVGSIFENSSSVTTIFEAQSDDCNFSAISKIRPSICRSRRLPYW
jgi:hypothetical protein